MLKIHYKGTHNFSSFINISACDICLSILFAFLFNKTLKCFLKSNLDSASTRRPRQSDNWTSFVRLSWERFQVQVVSYFHLFTHVRSFVRLSHSGDDNGSFGKNPFLIIAINMYLAIYTIIKICCSSLLEYRFRWSNS